MTARRVIVHAVETTMAPEGAIVMLTAAFMACYVSHERCN
jgi:hypothetical protein